MQLFAGVTLPIVNQVMALLCILIGIYSTIFGLLFIFSLYLPDYLSYGVTTHDRLVLHRDGSWTARYAARVRSEANIDYLTLEKFYRSFTLFDSPSPSESTIQQLIVRNTRKQSS